MLRNFFGKKDLGPILPPFAGPKKASIFGMSDLLLHFLSNYNISQIFPLW